jgi:hypothetical protein
LSLVTALSPYPTGENIQDVYWRTLVANMVQPHLPPPPEFFENFATYFEFDRLVLSCEDWDEVYEEAAKTIPAGDRVKHRLFNESLSHVAQKLLFTTANGYAGLGPRGVKKGDKICLILGAGTPFIIREKEPVGKTGNGDMFLLVGECYIHGLMEGEGIKMGKVRDIVLC